jgi:hypothetical protein
MYITDLADLLEQGGVVNVQEFVLQPDPDVCVALRPYGGTFTGEFGSEQATTENPRCQVLVRGAANDASEPATRAYAIWLLLQRQGVTINGRRYHTIAPLSTPFLLRRDENERYEWAFNVEVYKEL